MAKTECAVNGCGSRVTSYWMTTVFGRRCRLDVCHEHLAEFVQGRLEEILPKSEREDVVDDDSDAISRANSLDEQSYDEDGSPPPFEGFVAGRAAVYPPKG
jgi:hypothetical protein